ncbi:GNAT family N-acetyltransferase [Sediminivirga luteola]|uniref:GNAT family N-acetyltransferase n=1 Tax=Sediminivirga luteola TaxID=1774748 RepID=UPI001F59F2BE|nr:N-acetyltransferase [Sediminivirga luteola]
MSESPRGPGAAPQTPDIPVEIVDNLGRGRYELWRVDSDGGRTFIGFVGYRLQETGVVELQHTVISERFSRQGFARLLVTNLLDRLRERGERIVPTCTYVQSYLERFPHYQDLVAEGE